jgi:hypothetical protein
MSPSSADRSKTIDRSFHRPVAARWAAVAVAVALVVTACSSSSTPAPSTSAGIDAVSSASPSAEPSVAVSASRTTAIATAAASSSPVADETANPTESPVTQSNPSAEPTPSLAPGWSQPVHIGPTASANGPYCDELVGGIDSSHRDHVAFECAGRVYVASSSPGGTWTTTSFAPPAHRIEQDPQLAFWGDRVYLAYSRIAVTDGGCGDDGLRDVGVYYRTRVMPSGTWSAPVRIGAINDGIEDLAVDGSTLFATVANRTDGRHYLEVVHGGTTARYRLNGAVGPASLRVGDDGKARVVYTAAKNLDYVVLAGTTLTTSAIPKTGDRSWAPELVLGPGDQPNVLWYSEDRGGGCAAGEDPTDGLYLSTLKGSAWTSSRITKDLDSASLQVDPSTGRLYLIRMVKTSLELQTKDPGGSWTTSVVGSVLVASGFGLLRDPSTGLLLVDWIDDSGVEVMTHS